MVYSTQTEWDSDTVQQSCNGITPGWAMQVGVGGGDIIVESCTTASN